MDHTKDRDVSLQGVDFNYKEVCSPAVIDAHVVKMEAEKAKADALLESERRLVQEKKLAIAAKFCSAQEASKSVWPILEARVIQASSSCLTAISEHLKSDFICAGSYPAFIIANEMRESLGREEVPSLKYNDIDVYYGNFGPKDCDIIRTDCKWTQIPGIETEVNLILCENLNAKNLTENFDINAVAVCICVSVANDKASTVEWLITPEFWHFVLEDKTLRSWRTDSPARTLVRLAYKSYQMGLSFSMSSLSLSDGELFTSHKRKVEEMERAWVEYPFADYKLKAKSFKKSFNFVRVRVECQCGRKGNIKCSYNKCSKCCKVGSRECKVHVHN